MFLGNEKDLILCCVDRERSELLGKKNKTTSNENENASKKKPNAEKEVIIKEKE